MTAAALAALLEAQKYLWVGRSLYIEKSDRALLQAAQAVVDENISPRKLRLEFDHRRSAGGDQVDCTLLRVSDAHERRIRISQP
ncbi:MAG: hypothetical protein WCC90_17475, partial [Methylocella sp.]